jgi:hypothetical protein
MGRILLSLLVVLGITYGAWSIFRSDGDGEPLSTQVSGVGANRGGEGAQRAEDSAGDAESGRVGSSEPTPVEAATAAPDPGRASGLVERARVERERAAKAANRKESVTLLDRSRQLYSQALLGGLPADVERDVKARLTELNDEVLFSEEPVPGKSFLYTIQPNDNLWTLCTKVFPKKGARIESGFLLWVNGLSDPRRIREGQILKIPTEELSIVISKTRMSLWVLLGESWITEFAIGIGRQDRTPEGEFEIQTKIEEPAWYPGGRTIPYGHADNPLGTRWLGFKPTRQAAGYGIHGTDEPASIGRSESDGCVRMLNAEVETLFDWVPRGTKVRIVR